MPVKIPDRQGLHFFKQVLADRINGFLRNMHHNARIGKGAQRPGNIYPGHQHQHLSQTGKIAGQNPAGRRFEQIGSAHRTGCIDQQEHNHQHHGQLIASHIVQQLEHRFFRVLGFFIGLPFSRSHFSHRCSLLPAATNRRLGKFRCFPSGLRVSPPQKSYRHP